MEQVNICQLQETNILFNRALYRVFSKYLLRVYFVSSNYIKHCESYQIVQFLLHKLIMLKFGKKSYKPQE